MKYVILVGDGMGDYPLAELGGKPLLDHILINIVNVTLKY